MCNKVLNFDGCLSWFLTCLTQLHYANAFIFNQIKHFYTYHLNYFHFF